MIHAASWDTGHLGSLCSLGVGVATLHDWKSMFVNLRGNSYAPQLELGSKQTPFWIVFFASRCIFSPSPIFSLSGCPLWLPLMFCRRDNLPPRPPYILWSEPLFLSLPAALDHEPLGAASQLCSRGSVATASTYSFPLDA